MSDVPRRINLATMTPAELAIVQAVNMVEALTADVRLTRAVVLLQAARESVADFVDGVPPGEVAADELTGAHAAAALAGAAARYENPFASGDHVSRTAVLTLLQDEIARGRWAGSVLHMLKAAVERLPTLPNRETAIDRAAVLAVLDDLIAEGGIEELTGRAFVRAKDAIAALFSRG